MASAAFGIGVQTGLGMSFCRAIFDRIGTEMQAAKRDVATLVCQILKVAIPAVIFFGEMVLSTQANTFAIASTSGTAVGFAIGSVVFPSLLHLFCSCVRPANSAG